MRCGEREDAEKGEESEGELVFLSFFDGVLGCCSSLSSSSLSIAVLVIDSYWVLVCGVSLSDSLSF